MKKYRDIPADEAPRQRLIQSLRSFRKAPAAADPRGADQETGGASRKPTTALRIEWNDGPIRKTKLSSRTAR